MIIKIMRMKFAQLINYKQANAAHKHILGKCGQCHFRNCEAGFCKICPCSWDAFGMQALMLSHGPALITQM